VGSKNPLDYYKWEKYAAASLHGTSFGGAKLGGGMDPCGAGPGGGGGITAASEILLLLDLGLGTGGGGIPSGGALILMGVAFAAAAVAAGGAVGGDVAVVAAAAGGAPWAASSCIRTPPRLLVCSFPSLSFAPPLPLAPPGPLHAVAAGADVAVVAFAAGGAVGGPLHAGWRGDGDAITLRAYRRERRAAMQAEQSRSESLIRTLPGPNSKHTCPPNEHNGGAFRFIKPSMFCRNPSRPLVGPVTR
jgi:hypothetical protein